MSLCGAPRETISLRAEIFCEKGRIYAIGLMLSGLRHHMLATVTSTDWNNVDMSELLPTGTVTLLLADVEGSTRLWQTQPEAMTAAVALLELTATDVVAAHGGVRPVEQGEGDSFVAAFARASDAVSCAVELQRAVLDPIRIRIGLHTGEVQLRDEANYAGVTISKSARLRDLAHGGQTVMSSVTADLVDDQLPVGAWLIDLGRYELRDVARPMRVHQLCHSELCNDFPPLRTSKTTEASRLPAQLTSFVGRVDQLQETRTLVRTNRLVTLTGAGGAGKTRLAIELAGGVGTEFADGVWYADLAPITHAEVVPVAVARALGLPDVPGRSITDTLVRSVHDREILLLLDNCEHLLESCADLVGELLAGCPRLRILATSREPLNVPGEVNWPVPSLSVLDEAVELFVDRARRARPSFTVTADNAETVTEICRRLDGMPLAIELAAARVRALSLDEIVGSLHDRFRLLTGGARTAVRRQQTLRASVDWSHNLLTESERVLFRRLAVFLGGFDLDAAQAVAGTSEVERFQVLDQISLLVDKSLVVAESASGPTRYRLLETVRQYALEKLGESGEADAVRDRHRDHYLALAARLDAPVHADHGWLLDCVEVDIDNLRAAFIWSIENASVIEALELASALQALWLKRGRIQEGLAWLGAALAQEGQTGAAARARALADKAVLDGWVGASSPSEADAALAIARQHDDPALLARALYARGSAVVYDMDEATPFFTEAMGYARAARDQWRISQILGRQAHAAFLAGDPLQTIALTEEGRDLADLVGDRFESRQCRFRMAGARCHAGELPGAIVLLRDLLVETEADHDEMMRATVLLTLAHAEAHVGNTDAGLAAAHAAVAAAGKLGDFYLAAASTGLVVAALAEGDVALASEAEATALRGMGGLPGMMALNCTYFAQVDLARGDVAAARAHVDQAGTAATGFYRATDLTTRARVAIAEGDLDGAERDARESLESALGVGAFTGVSDTLELLAGLLGRADCTTDAARIFGAADRIRRGSGERRFAVYAASYAADLAMVRDALGENDFEAARSEGAALTVDEVIAYVQRGRGDRKRPSTGWESLTPTELDVVRLVAEGIPNKDIATRLFVSPRTIQSHLRHVYGKLALTSRVQLANEAARRMSVS